MRALSPSSLLLSACLCLVACPPSPVEGEGEEVGEGEGDVVSEGEGEGEGDVVGGEGEGDVVSGEGEGEFPVDGFGALSGVCGSLVDGVGDELGGADPAFTDNVIDFGTDAYDDPAERDLLTDGGARMAATPNAGGSSLMSEVFAFEVLARCEGATLFKTETEVEYTVAQTKITDLVVNIGAERYGVSVTRSFVFPPGTPLTVDEATRRLQGKLDDILVSSANVAPADGWHKQILAILSPEPEHVAVLRDAWENLDPATRADTIIYVTVTNGDDAFIY